MSGHVNVHEPDRHEDHPIQHDIHERSSHPGRPSVLGRSRRRYGRQRGAFNLVEGQRLDQGLTRTSGASEFTILCAGRELSHYRPAMGESRGCACFGHHFRRPSTPGRAARLRGVQLGAWRVCWRVDEVRGDRCRRAQRKSKHTALKTRHNPNMYFLPCLRWFCMIPSLWDLSSDIISATIVNIGSAWINQIEICPKFSTSIGLESPMMAKVVFQIFFSSKNLINYRILRQIPVARIRRKHSRPRMDIRSNRPQ